MQLLNNRYKIEAIFEKVSNGIVYEVIDLWSGNKKGLLKLCENNIQNKKIYDFFCNNFINFSNTKHKYILSNEKFDIVTGIDNKKVLSNQYFYTKEYVKDITLKDCYSQLSTEEILWIICQLCDVVEYLRFRGLIYEYISPKNIYIVKDESGIQIKLRDTASIFEQKDRNTYDESIRPFMAPEVFMNNDDNRNDADIYSLGMIIKFLLVDFLEEDKPVKDNLNNLAKSRLTTFIDDMTKKDTHNRKWDIKAIISTINQMLDVNYQFDFSNERERLIFTTEIIAREKEINQILEIDNQFQNRIYNKSLLLISGESGIGKTRLLQEFEFRLKMLGRSVYFTDIKDKSTGQLDSIKNILRQMINNCNSVLIDKYGCELVKIIPELKIANDINPSSVLSGEREMLRLYDRISNFIVDFIGDNPTYIILDDLHNSDEETLRLINYIIRNKKNCPLLFVVSYNNGLAEGYEEVNTITDSWSELNEITVLELLRFDLQETALMIKNILGISYKPMNFVTRIMSETVGNPRHIEEVIKNLHASGELSVNENGHWDLKTKVYSDIYIPSNVDEAIKNQIDFLDRDFYEIAKIISLFRTSVSKGIILRMKSMNKVKLNDSIAKLIDMKIVDEKVEDWGYTYDYYNVQIKKYIYHSIDLEERKKLHMLAARVLEDLYNEGHRGNKDELIYHLTVSNQFDKAIDYTIDLAKRMEGLMGNAQAISLWQKANELLGNQLNTNKLEVLVNLGRLFTMQGSNDNALEVFSEALKGAKLLNKEKYIVISKNSIAEIYYRRNDLDSAENYVMDAKQEAEKYNFVEGYLESVRMMNRIRIQKNRFDEVEKDVKKYMDIAKKGKYHSYVANFYNQIGVTKLFTGNALEAKKYFEYSIKYFDKAGDLIQATAPINNTGVIYTDYFYDEEKAMEFFQKSINICQKYNISEGMLVSLVNIGENYIYSAQYNKAMPYIRDTEKISIETEDERMVFLANVDLGRIYLGLGEYDKAFEYYKVVKMEYETLPDIGEGINEYLDFLGDFYFRFGNWDEALEFSIKARDMTTKKKIYIRAITRISLIEFYKNGILDKESLNKIRSEHRDNDFHSIRRRALLDIAMIAILDGDRQYAKEILVECEEMSKEKIADYLLAKGLVLNAIFIKDNINEILNLEDRVKNKYVELEILINQTLGEECLNNKDYYQAIYYFVVSLDILQRTAKKIPDKDFENTYLKKHNAKSIMRKIEFIKELISGNKNTKDITEEISIENYLDTKQFKRIFDSKEFYRSALKYFTITSIDDINSIQDLVTNFTDDYKDNLDLILKFAVKETFANKGAIFIYPEDGDQPKILASITDDCNINFIDQIASRVKQKNDGMLIKSSIGSNNTKEYVYLTDYIKALICIPIYKVNKDMEAKSKSERRKTARKLDWDEIIGYIYLDCDRLFNRFDEKRYELIEALSYLAFMNVENYNLKISSSIDKLTGVYTRKYFDMISEEIFSKTKIDSFILSVIMIDIDKFKVINDTFGHRKGDEVLTRVGEIILENVRNTDVVGRYGGEEFIIILPNTNEEESKKVAEKIREKIEEAVLISDDHPLTVSLGLSVYPQHGHLEQELIEKADQALYAAKQRGRNKSVIWSSDIGNSNKRLDKLVGIVSGNTVQDIRNVLALVELIGLIKETFNKEEKIHRLLGRLIEIIEGKQATLFILDDEKEIIDIYSRQVFVEDWIEDARYNEKIIQRVIVSEVGEYLIDWEDVENIDILTGTPNWKSLVVVPLIFEGKVKGILQIAVPINEKEFDYNNYNFVSTAGDIIAAII